MRITSERWVPGEAALAARLRAVRDLWRAPDPPREPRDPLPETRKMRARRRTPRRLPQTPTLNYCLEATPGLLCDPTCKFHFESPRPPHVTGMQRPRISASVQAAVLAARCQSYRGTNVSRYAPTCSRPARPDRRYCVWWPKDQSSSKHDHKNNILQTHKPPKEDTQNPKPKLDTEDDDPPTPQPESSDVKEADGDQTCSEPSEEKSIESTTQPESPKSHKEKVIVDDQMPTTSAAALDLGLRKKRLYSTVLSMSAPPQINLNQMGCVRLSQKLVTPGILKLNPKIVLPSARIRPPVVDNKFEELEKEALEQYKASDESIDTKFRELEKQAVEQYSNSNSNTSCGSGNAAEKRTASSPSIPEEDTKKQTAKFHKKSVDSVVIYSQNFPDLNTSKSQTNSSINLKNFHTPPRGEKKEHSHRKSSRNFKLETQRAASDTDNEERSQKGSHKGSLRWTLHVIPPKKRHLSMCVSDFSSDEDIDDKSGSIKDARPCIKNRMASKMKISAHGGGDLHPLMRKT